jgi:type II secretory pathway component PulC
MRVLKLIIKKYPLVVMVPLAAGIIFVGASAAHTVYQSLSYTPPALSSAKKTTENTPQPRPTLEQYAVIAQRNLFASAASSLEERAAESGKGAPSAASVPFKLKGTVVVTSGVSFAIVEDAATKKEELFHENDVVQGFRILKISRNKMIVDRNGYEEVVEVLEEEQEKTPIGPGGPLQRPRTIIRGPVRMPMPVPITPPPDEAP